MASRRRTRLASGWRRSGFRQRMCRPAPTCRFCSGARQVVPGGRTNLAFPAATSLSACQLRTIATEGCSPDSRPAEMLRQSQLTRVSAPRQAKGNVRVVALRTVALNRWPRPAISVYKQLARVFNAVTCACTATRVAVASITRSRYECFPSFVCEITRKAVRWMSVRNRTLATSKQDRDIPRQPTRLQHARTIAHLLHPIRFLAFTKTDADRNRRRDVPLRLRLACVPASTPNPATPAITHVQFSRTPHA